MSIVKMAGIATVSNVKFSPVGVGVIVELSVEGGFSDKELEGVACSSAQDFLDRMEGALGIPECIAYGPVEITGHTYFVSYIEKDKIRF